MLNQLQPILSQAAKHKKGRKAKVRPIFVSKQLELKYAKALHGFIDEMHKETLNQLLMQNMGDSKTVADSLLDRFLAILNHLKTLFLARVSDIATPLASVIVKAQQKASDKQLAELLKKQMGLDFDGLMRDEDLAEAINEAIHANVNLIKSIPQAYFDKIEKAVLSSIQSGTLNRDLAKQLESIESTTKSRANLIATDQLGKINSRISQIRQQKLGITHYTWSTSRDERVRHSHRLRDGQIFAWDNPPDDGHAGQAIRCRCVAIPYTEHLMGGKSPDEVMAEQQNSDNLGNQTIFDDLAKLQKPSFDKSLLTDNSKGLDRSQLPYIDSENSWGVLSKAHRKSKQLFDDLLLQGITPPPTWGVHHWSIDSRYISEILRGVQNPKLKDSLRQEFLANSYNVIDMLSHLYADNRSAINQDTLVYRGVGMSMAQFNAIKDSLKAGSVYQLMDKSFQSTTTDYELAKAFAERNSKDETPIKVIYQTLLKKGTKAIDITPYHYYHDNEILLDKDTVLEVLAMRKIDENTFEMVTATTSSNAVIGDKKAQIDTYNNAVIARVKAQLATQKTNQQMIDEGWELHTAHHDNAQDEHWSGFEVYGRRGGKLSDIKI